MSNLQVSKPIDAKTLEQVLIRGDLSGLGPTERLSYMKAVCDSVGVNPLTKPFEFIKLNGREVLYARRDCTDQLRKIHKVSVNITGREKIDEVYIVTAKGSSDGREDESTGAVNVAGLKGEALANAMMKAETKAKRRVTLSICGLGMLDETEVESIDNTQSEKPREKVVNQIQAHKKEKAEIAHDIGEYVIPFGKLEGKKLKDVDMFELNSYIKWIVSSAKNQGKEINGKWKTLVDNAESYLASLEVGYPESSLDSIHDSIS